MNAGDLMLHWSITLVLFYKSFPTGYSSTRLGQIQNPISLQQALGSRIATIRFEVP
ncbi:cyclophilin-like fold protein [Spirosoma linguale]|uniref:cyclophilin-like fold protein n=1 Tax=Spirosoma linguale TaxID=108 RepID=UPI003CC80C1C